MKHKNFIITFFLALLTTMTVNIIGLEYFSQKILVRSDNFINHLKTIEKKLTTTEIIALGDSHLSRGLNIKSDNYLNLAFPSDNTVIMYSKLEYFYKKGLRPKVLLLQADYHMFTAYREKFDYSKYLSFINDDSFNKIDEFYPNTEIAKERSLFNIPLYQMRTDVASNIYKVVLKYIQNPEKFKFRNNISSNGTIISKKSDWPNFKRKHRLIESSKRIKEQFPSGKIDLVNILDNYYQKIIQFAKQRNIRVIMVSMPISKEYIHNMSKEVSDTKKLNNYFKDISKKEKIEFLNYRHKFNNHNFYDQDHLDYESSTVLGNMLLLHLCQHEAKLIELNISCEKR